MRKTPIHKSIVNKVTRKDVNMYVYPDEIIPFKADPILPTQLIYGDLHGNFMNGLHWLVKQGVVEINSTIYEELGRIYKEHAGAIKKRLLPDANSKDLLEIHNQIKDFRILFSQVSFKNKPILKWGGDEVSDRGASDFFTFNLLMLAHKEKVISEIPISNHGLEFLLSYENFKKTKNPAKFIAETIQSNQTVSMFSLYVLLTYGIIAAEEIIDLVETSFKPNLKVFTYVIDPNSWAMGNHAFVGLEAVQWLAEYYQIPFFRESHLGICLTIDLINEKFNKSLEEGTLFDEEFMEYYAEQNFDQEKTHPLLYVTWYRNNFDELTAAISKDINIPEYIGQKKAYYIHGHDGKGVVPTSVSSYVINLDSVFGMWQEKHDYPEEHTYNSVIAYGHSTGYVLKMYREIELIAQNAANALPENCESSFLKIPSQLGANVLATKKVQAKIALVSEILQQLEQSSEIKLSKEQVDLLKEGDLAHIFESCHVLPYIVMSIKVINSFLKKKLEEYLNTRKTIFEKLTDQYRDLLSNSIFNYHAVCKVKTIVMNCIEGKIATNSIEFSPEEKQAISKNEELLIFINNYKEFFFEKYISQLTEQKELSSTKCVIA